MRCIIFTLKDADAFAFGPVGYARNGSRRDGARWSRELGRSLGISRRVVERSRDLARRRAARARVINDVARSIDEGRPAYVHASSRPWCLSALLLGRRRERALDIADALLHHLSNDAEWRAEGSEWRAWRLVRGRTKRCAARWGLE